LALRWHLLVLVLHQVNKESHVLWWLAEFLKYSIWNIWWWSDCLISLYWNHFEVGYKIFITTLKYRLLFIVLIALEFYISISDSFWTGNENQDCPWSFWFFTYIGWSDIWTYIFLHLSRIPPMSIDVNY